MQEMRIENSFITCRSTADILAYFRVVKLRNRKMKNLLLDFLRVG